nr:hypothetical protein GCM10020093_093610 [Planobispora longispora]
MRLKTLAAVAVLVPAATIGGIAWALRTEGSPEETARDFLAAWSRQDYPAMRALAAGPPDDFERWYRRFRSDLKLSGARFEVTGTAGTGNGPEADPKDDPKDGPKDGPAADATGGSAADTGDGTAVRFRARLEGPVDWTYDGSLTLVEHERTWRVSWTPAAVHPGLREGRRIKAVTVEADQAPVLAADGARIDAASAPGSVQQLVEELKKTYRDRLTGTSSARIELVRGNTTLATLATAEAKPGEELRTTIDLRVHRAAADALRDVDKPASLVALRPSTGEILAAANKPGGFNRALLGHYPPGSTFKVVTASALVADGMTAGERVSCPAEQNIGGFPFHNAGFKDYGTPSLREAFAHSCNTTFGRLSVDRLGGRRLGRSPGPSGSRLRWSPGAGRTGEVPRPEGRHRSRRRLDRPGPRADQPAQHGHRGGGHRRRLLAPAPPGGRVPSPAGPAAEAGARSGAGPAHADARRGRGGHGEHGLLPSGTAGKTGTAEYGSGEEPPSHAWFIGYRGDLAFAVVVEDGGSGSETAAPIAARFLTGLADLTGG